MSCYSRIQVSCLISLSIVFIRLLLIIICRAFRRLLFIEDKGSKDEIKTNAPTRGQLLALPFFSQLRPSTLLCYLISCAPIQLPLPFEEGINQIGTQVNSKNTSSIHSLIEILTNTSDEFLMTSPATEEIISIRGLYYSHSWKKSKGELQVWSMIQSSLDIYLQRLGVIEGPQKEKMQAWYDLINDVGGYYFGGRI